MPIPGPAAIVPKKVNLVVHQFDAGLTPDQIYAIGCRYVRRYFEPFDPIIYDLPLCKTDDGIDVYFRGVTYHLLKRKDKGGTRQIEISRIQRLHWIIPILENRIGEALYYKDEMGGNLGGNFQLNVRYRIYWIPGKKHTVILNFDQKEKAWKLNTAYQVTEPRTRKMLEGLFPRK